MFSSIPEEKYVRMICEILSMQGGCEHAAKESCIHITPEYANAWCECFDLSVKDAGIDKSEALRLSSKVRRTLDDVIETNRVASDSKKRIMNIIEKYSEGIDIGQDLYDLYDGIGIFPETKLGL